MVNGLNIFGLIFAAFGIWVTYLIFGAERFTNLDVISAAMPLLIAAVLFGAACIVHAVEMVGRKLEKKPDSAN